MNEAPTVDNVLRSFMFTDKETRAFSASTPCTLIYNVDPSFIVAIWGEGVTTGAWLISVRGIKYPYICAFATPDPRKVSKDAATINVSRLVLTLV